MVMSTSRCSGVDGVPACSCGLRASSVQSSSSVSPERLRTRRRMSCIVSELVAEAEGAAGGACEPPPALPSAAGSFVTHEGRSERRPRWGERGLGKFFLGKELRLVGEVGRDEGREPGLPTGGGTIPERVACGSSGTPSKMERGWWLEWSMELYGEVPSSSEASRSRSEWKAAAKRGRSSVSMKESCERRLSPSSTCMLPDEWPSSCSSRRETDQIVPSGVISRERR
mmetsp:Transcript_51377/g.165034  ORF Transcript_51377/g.165034 Transcript_51377/m.165034 type:complete len:227 (+) Transcript_51377:1971-2651(+)